MMVATEHFKISVQCAAGFQGEEEPRQFVLGEQELEITEILDRWLDPEHRYFKVRAGDDGVYILRHDAVAQHWEMTLFDSGTRPETRLSSS